MTWGTCGRGSGAFGSFGWFAKEAAVRVLFIYPEADVAPFYLQSPLGCLYLAAALEGQHEVVVYDQNVDDERLETVVDRFDPHVIGVSFTTGCRETSLNIARRYRGGDRLLIAGGIHPTYCPEECIEAGFALVARGEVEDTLATVLGAASPTPPFFGNGYTPPPGYFYKGSSGEYIDTGVARSPDINRWVPARHLLPAKYHRRYSHGVLMGSRGCLFGCTFCASARTGFREREPRLIVDELEYIVNVEGHNAVHFADDIFTYKPRWVIEICREIVARNVKCRWSINSRSDIPEKYWEMFDWMYHAGCEMVGFGIEAADQKTLKLSGKGLQLGRIMPVLQRAREAGIGIKCNLMAGLPGATYEDHLLSIDLMEAILPNQIVLSLTTPYPGTEMGNNPEKFGMRLKTQDWTTLLQDVYLKAEKFHDVIEYEHITTEEIIQYVDNLLARMAPYGYIRVSNDKEHAQRPERVIKTFLDKPMLPRLRDEAGRQDLYNRSSEPAWVL
jgi:magnesium-protoporphyrin IX monomethyl ester (oxidative) cyclase